MSVGPSTHVDVAIVGAGLCGLSTAYHLEREGIGSYLVLERELDVGGLARTRTTDGFSFDHSIHILYTQDAYAAELIAALLDSNLSKQARESYCYTHGVYTEYPYQANTYGLPPEIIAANILGLVEARLAEREDSDPPAHFEEWIYRTFGRGIAENFMIPYNRRVWACDLKEMSFDWISSRVPVPDLASVVAGALKPPERKYGPNREFWYPRTGGIQSLARSLARSIEPEKLALGVNVTRIDPSRHELVLDDGTRVTYDALVSTLALPALVGLLADPVPEHVRSAADGLRHNVVYTVNIGLGGVELGETEPMHWIYVPGDETVFHRLSFPSRFSSWMAPPDCASIQAEISVPRGEQLGEEALIDETLEGLVRLGFLELHEARSTREGGRIETCSVVRLDPAYIIYDRQRESNLETLRRYFDPFDISSHGRFGEWEYFNMDQAILSGKRAVEELGLGDVATEAVG